MFELVLLICLAGTDQCTMGGVLTNDCRRSFENAVKQAGKEYEIRRAVCGRNMITPKENPEDHFEL